MVFLQKSWRRMWNRQKVQARSIRYNYHPVTKVLQNIQVVWASATSIVKWSLFQLVPRCLLARLMFRLGQSVPRIVLPQAQDGAEGQIDAKTSLDLPSMEPTDAKPTEACESMSPRQYCAILGCLCRQVLVSIRLFVIHQRCLCLPITKHKNNILALTLSTRFVQRLQRGDSGKV